MNRRDFISSSGLATSSMLLAACPAVSGSNIFPSAMPTTSFQLILLATNWGYPGSIDNYCAQVKKEGYDGIEIWWPTQKKDQDILFDCLKKYDLRVGFLCAGAHSDYDEHYKEFVQMVDAATQEAVQKPLYINCHSGRDYFTFEQGKSFIDHTIALSKSAGIKICHETHRSRLLYSAPVARHYIDSIPDLRITLDVSHWCNVHESYLADQSETLNRALSRTDHIHARIGHPEGPQVNDPRAPEWTAAVEAHLAWWDKIVERKKIQGDRLTILTEFGPADYMPTLPYTRQPLGDQWAINVYMMQLLKRRYS